MGPLLHHDPFTLETVGEATEYEIARVAHAMSDATVGVTLKDRGRMLRRRKVKHCFTGDEACTWMMMRYAVLRLDSTARTATHYHACVAENV